MRYSLFASTVTSTWIIHLGSLFLFCSWAFAVLGLIFDFWAFGTVTLWHRWKEVILFQNLSMKDKYWRYHGFSKIGNKGVCIIYLYLYLASILSVAVTSSSSFNFLSSERKA